jgi:hypothetical protein
MLDKEYLEYVAEPPIQDSCSAQISSLLSADSNPLNTINAGPELEHQLTVLFIDLFRKTGYQGPILENKRKTLSFRYEVDNCCKSSVQGEQGHYISSTRYAVQEAFPSKEQSFCTIFVSL